MSRTETTAMLSKLVEKRLRNQTAFWASEVNFDRNTPDERRVDYVGFKPWNINGEPVPASVEKGCFEFYEVKSCMADFTSGNGLTFYGDQNYLVCTKELCDEIVWQKMVPPRVNAILTPDSTGSKLILDYVQSYNDLSYRRRPASEILWAMVKANGKRTNFKTSWKCRYGLGMDSCISPQTANIEKMTAWRSSVTQQKKLGLPAPPHMPVVHDAGKALMGTFRC